MDKLFIHKCNLGIIYKEPSLFWNMNTILKRLAKFEPFLNIRTYNMASTINLPSDLNAVALIPSETIYLEEFLSQNRNLKWVHSMFSGVDKFLTLSSVKENDDIILTNSRGAFAESLAEFVILSTMYFNYSIPTYFDAQLNKTWVRPLNTMIKGKTITLVGYGKNAVTLAKKVKLAHEMKVIGVKRNINHVEGKEYVDKLVTSSQLNQVLPETDFLVNLMPETKESVDYFNMEIFKLLKPSSVFINIGRGSAVVEDDLVKCLNDGTIRGAVLDVTKQEPLNYDSPLYLVSPKKLLLSCHTADNTDEYFDQAVEILEKNIECFLKGATLYSVVDKNKGY